MSDLFDQFDVQESPKAAQQTDLFDDFEVQSPSVTERNALALGAFSPVGAASDPLGNTVVMNTEAVDENRQQMLELAQTRFTPEQIEEFQNSPISWSEAGQFLEYEDVVPLGGLYQGYELYRATEAAGKLERGESLTQAEEDLLYGLIDKEVEMSLRGFTVGGGVRYYGSQVPAFAVEFAATGGAGKLAQTAAVKGAKAVAIQGVKSTALRATGRAATRAVGATANVAARTAAMPSLYAPMYAERRLSDEVAITDKGAILAKESQESPAKSAMMAFGYTSAEVASEMSGLTLNKYLINPALGKLKTPLISAVNQVPARIRNELYKAYLKIKPNAKVSQAFTSAGWNGMLAELGEERVNAVLQGALGLAAEDNYTVDTFLDQITPSKDQLLIESGIIAIAGGVKTSADLTLNLLKTNGVDPATAKEMTDNMSANEQEEFVSNHLLTPVSKFQDVDLKNFAETSLQNNVGQGLDLQESLSKDGLPVAEKGYEGEVADAQIAAAELQDPPRILNEESFFNRLHREWVNELEPIQALPEKARKLGKEVPPLQDTKLLSTAYAGTLGATRQMLQVSTFRRDENGNNVVTGKALKPILDDFSNIAMEKESSVKKREQDFGDYLVARRYLEDLSNREGVEVSEEQRLESMQTMARLSEKYGEDFEFFGTFAEEVYGFQQRVLSNLVDSGVLSQEAYDDIVAANPNYIPFDRVLEDETFAGAVSTNGVFTKANANRIVRSIKGSDKEVKNVFHTIIRNTARIMDMSRRNEVALSVANLADVMPEYIQKVPTPMAKVGEVETAQGDTKAIFRPSQFQPKGTMVVRREGKKEFYKVSPPILEAIESINAGQLNFVEKILQTSAAVLRAGATLVPEFWIRNVLRDQQTALLQSGVKYRPTDFARGMFAVMGKTDLYNEWERSGGSFNSYMELDDNGLEKAYKELFRQDGRLMRYLKNPINLPADISQSLEQATRVGIFYRAQQEGQTSLEATLTARDATLNFARRGSLGKKVNRMVPFFNAGLQGTSKLMRTFKDNPKATAFWGVSTITLPSMFLAGYYLYGAPEDERQEYLEIPDWQKDMFWVAKVDGEWRRYPKPFTFGYIFGSMPERIMRWAYEGDKPEGEEMWKDLVLGLGGSVSPVYDASALLPPLLKVSLENVTNYNFFTGRRIHPEWMERLDPELRSNKYTSESAKFLGEKLGVSPAKIDNALRGQLAGSASYVTGAGDHILNKVKEWNGEDVPERPITNSDKHVLKAFAVRDPAGYRSVSAQNFFDNYNEAQRKRASAKRLEGEKHRDYVKEHGKVIAQYKPLNSAYKQMRGLQKEIDAIYEDPKMSSERKVKRIRRLEDQITIIARQANSEYNRATKGQDK